MFSGMYLVKLCSGISLVCSVQYKVCREISVQCKLCSIKCAVCRVKCVVIPVEWRESLLCIKEWLLDLEHLAVRDCIVHTIHS